MTEKAVEARITGRVQGVWFRQWTCDAARAKGLKGWVRNASDGSVEAVFSGPEEAVGAMLALCRIGPPQARVVNIEARATEAPSGLKGFEVRR
ncbi:MAG: acylphosphatase [Parvularculaceae bacterium]